MGENAVSAYGPKTISMRLLLITNLYPPRSWAAMAAAWPTLHGGCSNADIPCKWSAATPYLGPNSSGPSGEPVDRRLQLKGSFQGGISQLQEPAARAAVDINNRALLLTGSTAGTWDGILLGNLDLLGTELLAPLLASGLPLLHHIGFVTPPYPPEQMPPKSSRYRVLAASTAVRNV